MILNMASTYTFLLPEIAIWPVMHLCFPMAQLSYMCILAILLLIRRKIIFNGL
jgi:hypothetical protein